MVFDKIVPDVNYKITSYKSFLLTISIKLHKLHSMDTFTLKIIFAENSKFPYKTGINIRYRYQLHSSISQDTSVHRSQPANPSSSWSSWSSCWLLPSWSAKWLLAKSRLYNTFGNNGPMEHRPKPTQHPLLLWDQRSSTATRPQHPQFPADKLWSSVVLLVWHKLLVQRLHHHMAVDTNLDTG